jgi:hypothetical protein
MKTYIGIDNGVTGSIAILQENDDRFFETPIKVEQSYTKKKQNITRLSLGFLNILDCVEDENKEFRNTLVIIERPMVNPTRFKATLSAIRCLEATLFCLETKNIPYMYIDSKEWQRELLPKGLQKEELKKASCDIACRLFPEFKDEIIKHKDGDALLIAEYARRKNL